MKNKIKLLVFVATCLSLLGLFLHWTVNRVNVPEGYSLQLRYKGPLLFGSRNMAQQGYWAKEGEIGVLERLRGPGRHFYCPIWWERTFVEDVIIKPAEVGVVTCKLGEPLPEGEFLVDGEIGEVSQKGTLRKVLGPGKYRINPYGFETKIVKTEVTSSGKRSGWIEVPAGFVGVVTNLSDDPITKQKSGIQDKILPPGLYPMNPIGQQVDIVEIGYHETSINITSEGGSFVEINKAEEEGQNVDQKIKGGINFPSADGFPITMDFTAVWGLMPEQAPNAIRKFGNVALVENKVVLPQIESICRNNGSEYTAVKLLVGQEREIFQNKTLKDFKEVLKSKEITLLYGLVRHIYIPSDVRKPIQMAYISDELKLTRDVEQTTAKEESKFRESEKKVDQATQETEALTKKLVAEALADGDKIIAEMEAETRKLVASINKETAELKSQAILLGGKADNEGKQLVETAKANKFKLAVAAFGTPNAYNNWTFATNLPDEIKLNMIYAGVGTFWGLDLNKANLQILAPSEPKK
jgi:regulator of protease activity HflC (stomatin/prohibitin superfamily)